MALTKKNSSKVSGRKTSITPPAKKILYQLFQRRKTILISPVKKKLLISNITEKLEVFSLAGKCVFFAGEIKSVFFSRE